MQEESLRGIIAQFLVAEAEPGVVVDESHGLVLSSRKGRKDRKGGSFS